MKFLTLFILFAFSLNLHASDKCYNQARSAAMKFALAEGHITSEKDFVSEFDSEISEISEHSGSWHKEVHSFYNYNYGINVEVDFVAGKCFVKKTNTFQIEHDQD